MGKYDRDYLEEAKKLPGLLKDIQDIRERLIKIETLLENYNKNTDLKLNSFAEKLAVANHRIADLEDNNKWLWRTTFGAIITSAIAILFKFV